MPDTPETSPKSTTPLTFEAGLRELEAIVREMEGAELPLDRALDLFERGTKLSEACRKQLSEAETRVEILMKRARRRLGGRKSAGASLPSGEIVDASCALANRGQVSKPPARARGV